MNRIHLGLLLVLLLVPATDEAAAARRSPVEFEPDPRSGGTVRPSDGAWEVDAEDYRARMSRLGDEERRALLVERTGVRTDPFASAPDRPPGFFTFLLELENRSAGTLVFQPQNCLLVTNRKEILYPLDLPTLMTTYGLMDRDLPPAYEAVSPALLDGEQILAPGRSISGLLVYPMVHRKTRSFVVDVVVTTPRGDVEQFSAPYRRAGK